MLFCKTLSLFLCISYTHTQKKILVVSQRSVKSQIQDLVIIVPGFRTELLLGLNTNKYNN